MPTTTSRIESLKKILESDPNDSFSRYALALEYDSGGDSQLAVTTLLEVIGRDPKYVPAFHQLGRIYTRHNRTQEAKAIYRRGIEAAVFSGELSQGDFQLEKKEMEEELEELEDEW
ncbi:MAG: tetratricopeptide repeat protein [Bacteroidota bacterium]|nr:tetratricopeptide repeat protein [Bacteroidota bacterium]